MCARPNFNVGGQKVCSVLAPAITNMIELSFEEGIFPESFKHVVVRSRIKNPSLDPLDIKDQYQI